MLGKKSHIVGRTCDEDRGRREEKGCDVGNGEGAVSRSVMNGII